MADGLNVVSVRIQHEGTVVVSVIVRPHARRAVVPATRGQRGLVERVDLRAIVGAKRDVQRWRMVASSNPEIRLGRHT